jgi:alpha-D-ribose 1-methylphosphonate 5-triphosphate synthase subunit PhnH
LTLLDLETSFAIHTTDKELEEIEEWKKSRGYYPLGIDIFLVSRTGDIIGIPR